MASPGPSPSCPRRTTVRTADTSIAMKPGRAPILAGRLCLEELQTDSLAQRPGLDPRAFCFIQMTPPFSRRASGQRAAHASPKKNRIITLTHPRKNPQDSGRDRSELVFEVENYLATW